MGTEMTSNMPYEYSRKDLTNSPYDYHAAAFSAADAPFSSPGQNRASVSNVSEDQKQRFASLGAGVAGWISEHLLLHPFVVIRRQCQVNHTSYWCHRLPFTLVQPMFNLQRQQNVACLWKGAVSTLVVKAIGYASESAISEFTSLPKEVTRHSSWKKIGQHLFLKSISFVIVTPFYAASLVETVQATEKSLETPGIFDWLKEGCSRILNFQSTSGTRLIPLWKLFLPTVLFGVSHYVISSIAQYNVAVILKKKISEEARASGDTTSRSEMNTAYETYYPELFASFIGHLTADIILYPLETVVHRLFIQGTRTIIDNMDTGLDVVPTNTSYGGPLDCIRTMIHEEGFSGFYKGFGALVLQYATHQVILKFTRFLLERISMCQDNNEPILASELSRMQNLESESLETSMGSREDPLAYASRRDFANTPNMGDHPSFSQMDRSYATSTPYVTPTSTSYRSHTGTGMARK